MKVAKLGSGPLPVAISRAISTGIGVSITGGAPTAGDILVADSDEEAHWEAPTSSTLEVDGTPDNVTPVTVLEFTATGDATVTVTDDGGGHATVNVDATSGGGGGGSAPYPYPLDRPPASPSAWDDEFMTTGTTMDAKWSLITSASGMATDANIGGGWAVLEPNTGGSSSTGKKGAWGFRQPAPTGDFTVQAKYQDSPLGSDDPRGGIFIGYTGGSAYIVGADTGAANNLMVIQASGFSTTAEWGGYSGVYTQLSRTFWTGAQGWFRIRYDSAADVAYWECDVRGIGFWEQIASTSSLAQPDYIGICMWSNSAALRADHKFAYGHFRVVESI